MTVYFWASGFFLKKKASKNSAKPALLFASKTSLLLRQLCLSQFHILENGFFSIVKYGMMYLMMMYYLEF